ncbi:MAG: hypothetical protein ACOZBH_04555 [Patescibacteria group bacterium]
MQEKNQLYLLLSIMFEVLLVVLIVCIGFIYSLKLLGELANDLQALNEPIIGGAGEVEEIIEKPVESKISIGERQDLLNILNYEMGKLGTITLNGFDGRPETLIKAILIEAQEREVKEAEIDLGDKTLSVEEYSAEKADFINKLQ